MTEKITALISYYGTRSHIEKVEVSITYPKSRVIVTHKTWLYDPLQDVNAVTDEIMFFCKKHNVQEIIKVDSPLPVSESSGGKCPHCNEDIVRVPWN